MIDVLEPVVGTLNLLPLPQKSVVHRGFFIINSELTVSADRLFSREAELLVERISWGTGYKIRVSDSQRSKRSYPKVRLLHDHAIDHMEGYHLTVNEEEIVIRARTAAGAFYGIQTLIQLMPASVYDRGPRHQMKWEIPCCEIEDSPRFEWRGMMLDSARYFQPVEYIKKWIDLLAQHKFNRFHWHLTDDQGWRIEIKKYPKLTEIGAWRYGTINGHALAKGPVDDSVVYGGYYTQEEVREIVAYAAERHITVIPEIEMPGHAQAAVASYPELGVTNNHYKVSQIWGVHEVLFNPEESTLSFLKDVLSEVIDLFPSLYIHIGGDEAVKTQWDNCPKVQQRIQELGLSDSTALQSWFVAEIGAYLKQCGRKLIGWDEILQGGLSPEATVMCWRGEEEELKALKNGHMVILCPKSPTYFDYYQSKRITDEPLAIGGYVPLQEVFDFEPLRESFVLDDTKLILGVQGQVWTEYIPTTAHMEYMVFPRACALAEVAWGKKKNEEFQSFRKRLRVQLKRLDCQSVRYCANFES